MKLVWKIGRYSFWGVFLALKITFMQPALADSLTPMADTELSAISGGDAIQLTLRLRNNVDANNDPLGCTPGTLNPCRLGLEFTDREGKWLMLKEFYGTIALEDMRLEGVTLDDDDSSYRDESRFEAANGNCLLAGCDPNGLTAIQLTYPQAKGAGEYNDMTTFLNIGRMALEFDTPGDPGYMLDNNTGSALAFRASDSASTNGSMQMRFEGRAMIYGF